MSGYPNAPSLAAGSVPVASLAPGLAGQLLGGTGPGYVYPPGFEISYDQITGNVNVVSTTEGAPTAIIAGTSHTYENVPYLFHAFTPFLQDSTAANGIVTLLLIQDAASIGRIAALDSVTVTTQMLAAASGFLRFTPTAGAHTFGVSAFTSNTGGTPLVAAGAGGSGVYVPAFLRVTKC